MSDSTLHLSGPVDCSVNYKLYNDTQENPSNVCLDTSAVVGLAFQAEAGLVSLIALLLLVGTIIRNYRRNIIKPPPGPWRLFRGNIDILMLNLIFADIWMSIGSIPNIYWAHRRQVYCGPMCNAQGAIQTIGETAVAFATILVTLYTFFVIYTNRRPEYRPWYCLAAIAAMWLWVILWGLIPMAVHSGQEPDSDGARIYYTPTPWWCWINGRYMKDRIVAEYLWLWVAGLGTICFYFPSYLILRKNRKQILKAFEADPASGRLAFDRSSDMPSKMLYYPLAYTLCILPLSIMRWAAFANPSLLSNPRMNPPSMVFSVTFYLMGLINVLLTIWIRPSILLLTSDGQLGPHDPRYIKETRHAGQETRQIHRSSASESSRQHLAPENMTGWQT
ncbi:G protein coupled glucose receptor regulating Gpa2 protein [Ceratobasidium sp. AG-Ba]|nr:G protein coupled glucose receptor regulating Gpa2 protein [Ceratobasidium sp. AG-Ba]